MVVIIDYGMGNLRSVENALKKVNIPCKISSNIEDLEQAKGLILPGVGTFSDCMKNLNSSGLIPIINDQVSRGKALLGICLGMQVLFEEGDEGSICEGLGLLKGKIIKMEDKTVKVPHIGWNMLKRNKEHKLFNRFYSMPFVYYVHSYYACDYEEDDLLAYSTYGNMKIPGIFIKGNIIACQFHPEKSGEEGLEILRYFKEVVKC